MNWMTIVSVVYVLVAVAMVALILMQRGSGAAAGAGFGAGASATVFGASGSANFLSTTTKWLAVVFFGMSLGMAWHASRSEPRSGEPEAIQDIGLMGDQALAPEVPVEAPANNDAAIAPAEPASSAVDPAAASQASPPPAAEEENANAGQ